MPVLPSNQLTGFYMRATLVFNGLINQASLKLKPQFKQQQGFPVATVTVDHIMIFPGLRTIFQVSWYNIFI